MNIYYEPVNLLQWDMFENVREIGHVEPFLATKSMRIGDIVLLHVGQQHKRYDSGVYAIGVIESMPYIVRNSPQDYCNNKLSVDIRIVKINYSYPYISHQTCKHFINQFRTVHKIQTMHYMSIMDYLKDVYHF